MDNCCASRRAMGIGPDDVLHNGGIRSHPSGAGGGCRGNPPDPGSTRSLTVGDRTMRLQGLGSVVAVVVLAAGCAGGIIVSDEGPNEGPPPDLVYAAPGVQVIADYDEPIFYSDSFYWRFSSGRWYRSRSYSRGLGRRGATVCRVEHRSSSPVRSLPSSGLGPRPMRGTPPPGRFESRRPEPAAPQSPPYQPPPARAVAPPSAPAPSAGMREAPPAAAPRRGTPPPAPSRGRHDEREHRDRH